MSMWPFDGDPFTKDYYRSKCFEIIERKRSISDERDELYAEVQFARFLMTKEQNDKLDSMIIQHKELSHVYRE